MGVRDFKDKEWDTKYEQFKLAKERRRQAENAPAANSTPVRPENTVRSHRNDLAAKKEERIFVNKGPSRYLKNYVSHSQQRESTPQPRPAVQVVNSAPAAKITLIKDDDKEFVKDSADDMVVAVEPESEKSKSPSLDIIPYILILFAIVIIVLKLTKVV